MDHVWNEELDRRGVADDVFMARKALAEARAALDLAVADLPQIDGDEAMASPALLVLLVSAVRAKEKLGVLEGRILG